MEHALNAVSRFASSDRRLPPASPSATVSSSARKIPFHRILAFHRILPVSIVF
jgi:hypothetical protein